MKEDIRQILNKGNYTKEDIVEILFWIYNLENSAEAFEDFLNQI